MRKQVRSQVLRFGWEKYIFRGDDFCFHYMFKTNFSGHNKIWDTHKKFGGTAPNSPLWLQACVKNRIAEPEPGAPELDILPGAGTGAQIKNQKEPELSLKLGPELELWPFER